MAKSLFGGKESYSEELKEAKALKSGKISEKQFVRGEKSEGHCGGGKIKKMAGGGYVRAADGCAIKGKTKGRMV